MWRLLLGELILVALVAAVWLLGPLVGLRSVLWRIVQFPLTRLVLALLFVTVGMIAAGAVVRLGAAASWLDPDSPAGSALQVIVVIPVVSVAY